jgi:glycosyltransferase involved in cell wall biosynthesis
MLRTDMPAISIPPERSRSSAATVQPTSVLYLSYDGMLEPLGQSQVLAYLEQLAPGRNVHLISFEKKRDWVNSEYRHAVGKRIANAGITWHPQRWHNRPRILAAVYNLLVGTAAALSVALRNRVSLFHARSILCSAMALPAVLLRRGKLISDIRGFWPDERVDAGLIPANGLVYRVLKVIERAALRRSSAVVTLTNASVPILRDDPKFGHPEAPITVIPTCVDLDRFRPRSLRRETEQFVLGYVGSFGTWYMLEETIALFAALRERQPEARFLIVNRHDHQAIRAAFALCGVPESACELRSAPHGEMPELIAGMTAGVCLVRPQFSKISSAPTKFAEYLACGVPVVATDGVGDLGEIIRETGVGLAASRFDPPALGLLAGSLLDLVKQPGIRERCRAVAEQQFSLEDGVAKYRRVYEALEGEGGLERVLAGERTAGVR